MFVTDDPTDHGPFTTIEEARRHAYRGWIRQRYIIRVSRIHDGVEEEVGEVLKAGGIMTWLECSGKPHRLHEDGSISKF